MKKVCTILITLFLLSGGVLAQGKYAGTKKSMIGKVFTDIRNLTALKGWTFMEGGLATPLSDPERIISDVFKKGTTYLVIFSIMQDTVSEKYTVADIVEITGVGKGWTVRSSFCSQNGVENNYIMVLGKVNTEHYMNQIKKAWKFDPDRRRINAIPVKGIECENIGC